MDARLYTRIRPLQPGWEIIELLENTPDTGLVVKEFCLYAIDDPTTNEALARLDREWKEKWGAQGYTLCAPDIAAPPLHTDPVPHTATVLLGDATPVTLIEEAALESPPPDKK